MLGSGTGVVCSGERGVVEWCMVKDDYTTGRMRRGYPGPGLEDPSPSVYDRPPSFRLSSVVIGPGP